MKIRTFLVDVTDDSDPIKRLMLRDEPPMGAGAWTSYHYEPGSTRGVVSVRYDPDAFDAPAVLGALEGVELVQPEVADRPLPEVAQARRDSIRAQIERRGGTWDEARAVTWEDAVVELMRRNGSPAQTTLRKSLTSRTRQYMDEHG